MNQVFNADAFVVKKAYNDFISLGSFLNFVVKSTTIF